MTASEEAELSAGDYEAAVAIKPIFRSQVPFGGDGDDAGPGFDDTAGFRDRGRHVTEAVLAKGDAAVKLATESIARQIGVAAQRITAAIEAQSISSGGPAGSLGLESVEVSFGVTLMAGVEALFTAKEESSVHVTIILSRRP